MTSCPLCNFSECEKSFSAKAMGKVRSFHHCVHCGLVFVPEEFHLDADKERQQYDLHQNEASNQGYLKHLEPVLNKSTELTREGDRILDYGCGPGPVLAEKLEDSGRKVVRYDPFFYPTEPEGEFDLVTCTEVVEHFSQPKSGWERLFDVVNKGKLLVMTSITDGVPSLKDWHYIRDVTHVSFYSQKTMRWIAEKHGRRVSSVAGNVSLFER